jgi:hypothetical protein
MVGERVSAVLQAHLQRHHLSHGGCRNFTISIAQLKLLLHFGSNIIDRVTEDVVWEGDHLQVTAPTPLGHSTICGCRAPFTKWGKWTSSNVQDCALTADNTP